MAKIESSTITTGTSSTLIYTPLTRPENNNCTRVRIYVYAVPSTGGWNGATATLFSSPDGGTTKVAERNVNGTAVAFVAADGYADLDVPSRVSKMVTDKPISYYLNTTVAAPTGIKATIFDLN